MTDRTIRDEIISFVNKYYANQYACLISGSYVQGTNNKYSDIDLIIFTKDRNTVFNETITHGKLKIQSIIVPLQNIQEILWVDYVTCKGAFIHMIASGKIIFDNSNFLKSIISHTKKLNLIGGRPLNSDEIYKSRIKITSLLLDLKGNDNIDELTICITDLLELLTAFILKVNRQWCGDGKYRMRFLNSFDQKYTDELLLAIKEVFGNKNKYPLISIVEKTLNNHGGAIPYYSKRDSFVSVPHNYFTIEISLESQKKTHKVLNTIQILSAFFDSLSIHDVSYYYFLAKPIGKNKLEQNLYFVIKANKDLINNSIIDRLSFLVYNNKKILKTKFPFQFDPKYRFSNDHIYESVTPIFAETNKILNSNNELIFDENFQIEFSILLIKEIKKNWFNEEDENFILFLDYLLSSWLVYTFDDGTTSNTKQLLLKKEETIRHFNELYSNQKVVLKNLYKEKKFNYKDLILKLDNSEMLKNIEEIPLYKTYFLNDKLSESEAKKWSLFKSVLFRTLSSALLDHRLMAYIPFVINKIEMND